MNINEHTVLVAKITIRMTAQDANVFVLPLIFLDGKLLISYAEYAYEKRQKSSSWHQKSASAVALFMRYLTRRRKDFPDPVSCFRAFVDDLEFGTIDPITLEDSSSLFWFPKSLQSINKIISYVTLFNEYNFNRAEQLATETNTPLKSILLNPKRLASFAERNINLAAWHHKYSNSFLPHTRTINKAHISTVNSVNTNYRINNKTKLYTFPNERIFDLLNAFRTRTKLGVFTQQHNLRDMLITLLMHFGGLRVSEPFHLFVEDIMENPNHPNEALVKLYHPDSRRMQLGKMGLRTRTDKRNPHSYYSGWKNKDINEVTTVKWFPVEAGQWFWEVWVLYMTQQRVESAPDRIHPFAFTNKNGDPASYGNFQQAHKRAVERIGLVVAKENGTTPHSHRHRYGSDIWEATKDSFLLQKLLRHSSPISQYIYIHHNDENIRSELHNGFATLKKAAKESKPLDQLYDSLKQEISNETTSRLPEYLRADL
ncbi:site-specific integrase [Vibrio coralliilyticus]|uniref:gamma-mobile-trio recombinase GmtY n=1 Tax=Vibrio coralliilyticus TaxID=190893 RepID=UPI00156180C7|nr:gamma-mobile-trio recombinase GmtY [Vibrio coralliilyticus]NRF26351.1 site-specific integrase [Vibrio coralliilyticus]NRF80430.1 site-specific integrase [Vibrio coralliilyticus]